MFEKHEIEKLVKLADAVKDSYIELEWDGSEKEAKDLARKFGCTVESTGRMTGSAELYEFSGSRANLKRLIREYGIPDGSFDRYIEDSLKMKDNKDDEAFNKQYDEFTRLETEIKKLCKQLEVKRQKYKDDTKNLQQQIHDKYTTLGKLADTLERMEYIDMDNSVKVRKIPKLKDELFNLLIKAGA